MLLMKTCGVMQRGVSITNATIVGNVDAKASVMMAPLADLRNTKPNIKTHLAWTGVSQWPQLMEPLCWKRAVEADGCGLECQACGRQPRHIVGGCTM